MFKLIFGLIKLIIFICFLGLVLFFSRHFLVKKAVVTAVKKKTGLNLHVDKIDINFKETLVDIQGLRLSNPEGYQEPLMMDIPQAYVRFNVFPLLSRKLHIYDLKLHLRELVIIRDKEGVLNLNALKVSRKQAPDDAEEPPRKRMDIQIDALELVIGKVIFKDYSTGGKPTSKEYTLNITERARNITDMKSLLKFIVMKALAKTTINQLFAVDNILLDQAFDFTRVGSDLFKGIKDTISGTKDSTKKIIGTTTGGLKETTKGITEVLTGSFGN